MGGECKQQHGSTCFCYSSHGGLKVTSKIYVLAHSSLLIKSGPVRRSRMSGKLVMKAVSIA